MVTSVRDDDGRAVVQVREGAVLREETFDACLLAMPTTVSRCIAPSMSLPQSEFFDNLHGVPMISLHLGLRAQPASKASMILIPEQESADIMMILLDHNKVDGRTPPGKGICTIWSTKEWTRANTDSSDERVTIDLCRLAEPFVGKVRPLIEFSHIERRDFVVAQTYPGFFTRLRDYMATRDFNQPIFFAGDFSAEGIEGAVTCGLDVAGKDGGLKGAGHALALSGPAKAHAVGHPETAIGNEDLLEI